MITKKLFIGLLAVMQSLYLIAGVGDQAKDFTVTTLSGGTYTLSNDYGKVILVFFFGYNCPYCLAHGPEIQKKIINTFTYDPNFTAVGVDVWNGSNSAVEAFKTSTGLTIPLGVMASDVGTLYGVQQDVLMVIDARQQIIFQSQTYQDASDAAKSKVQEALNALSNPTAVVNTENETVQLEQNYPNPFTSVTTIPYEVEIPSVVRLSVIDITGKTLIRLVDEYQPAGKYEVTLNNNQLKQGLYIYKLESGKGTIYRQMIKQ